MVITIVKKEPGKLPEVVSVDDRLEIYKDIVGGYLELVVPDSLKIYKLDLWCNEDGQRLELAPNLWCDEVIGSIIVGTVFIASHNGPEMASLKDIQISMAKKWLVAHQIDRVWEI